VASDRDGGIGGADNICASTDKRMLREGALKA
jgi:hypothetical protein